MTPITKTSPRQDAAQKQAALAMDGSAAVNQRQDAAQKTGRTGHGWQCGRDMAGAGREQTAFRAGNPAAVSQCDAKCDAISADRVELLARAVILVAGMAITDTSREAVLARVVADLTAEGWRAFLSKACKTV